MLSLILAQTTKPAELPFFQRMIANDTVRNTAASGWLTLFGGILGGVVIGKIVHGTLGSLAARLTRHGWPMRSIVARSFAGPANLAFIGAGISLGTGQLAPSSQLSEAASKGLGLLYIVAAAWLLYNFIDLVDQALRSITARTESRLDDQLFPLITKTIRVFLIVIIALFTAENVFGANIGAWLAGLGIAGLAVSLAAQDSIKNVFGSITILMDQPFAQGDLVNAADVFGIVEEVGFRSSRLRTLDGVLVTIPNSKLADCAISNLARRPAIRRVIDVTITYDTPIHKVHEALAILKGILAEPEIASAFDLEKNPPRVFFDDLNTDSLNLKVFYWFTPVDYWAYLAHGEKVNLLIIERLERAGIDMAFPTRTLYLASDPLRPLYLSTDGRSASPVTQNSRPAVALTDPGN